MIHNEKVKPLAEKLDIIIKETFDLAIKNQKNHNDFILFLENAHLKFGKPIIGQGIDGIRDIDRLEYFLAYTKISYKDIYNREPDLEVKELIQKLSIHQELMIYSHFWESKVNLTRLLHLTYLIKSKEYNWDLKFPVESKQKLVRIHIRAELKRKKLRLADAIRKCYRSQIRNAFSHSQYSFESNSICLDNYSGADWQEKKVSFDMWHDYFIRTALIFDLITKNIAEYKKQIAMTDSEFKVILPNGNTGILIYVEESNRFEWKR